jgi:hypothetical protein
VGCALIILQIRQSKLHKARVGQETTCGSAQFDLGPLNSHVPNDPSEAGACIPLTLGKLYPARSACFFALDDNQVINALVPE